MEPKSEIVEFIAILVFTQDDGFRTLEPLVIEATHPEIAYQRAVARGREPRYGRTFVGIAELAVKTEDFPLVGESRSGNAEEHVTPKKEMSAFCDPRWKDIACDARELELDLREPPALVEVQGLESVDWGSLSHAYGRALDVPIDLRRLASSDADVRAQALWELSGTIYHQGSVYEATKAAVRFLIQLAANPLLPDRDEILGLVKVIAESSTFEPETLRQAWEFKKKLFGDKLPESASELAAEQIEFNAGLLKVLRGEAGLLRKLGGEADPKISELARGILKQIGEE